MTYSSKNWATIEGQLAHFDYTFKQLSLVHEQYHDLFDDSEKLMMMMMMMMMMMNNDDDE